MNETKNQTRLASEPATVRARMQAYLEELGV
jgi:hypothetical protein